MAAPGSAHVAAVGSPPSHHNDGSVTQRRNSSLMASSLLASPTSEAKEHAIIMTRRGSSASSGLSLPELSPPPRMSPRELAKHVGSSSGEDLHDEENRILDEAEKDNRRENDESSVASEETDVIIHESSLRVRCFTASAAVLVLNGVFVTLVGPNPQSMIAAFVLLSLSIVLCAAGMAQAPGSITLIKPDRHLAIKQSDDTPRGAFFENSSDTIAWGTRVLAETNDRV